MSLTSYFFSTADAPKHKITNLTQEKFAEKLQTVYFVPVSNAEIFIHRDDRVRGVVALDVRIPKEGSNEWDQSTFFYYEVPGHPIENIVGYQWAENKTVVPKVLESWEISALSTGVKSINRGLPRPIGWVRKLHAPTGFDRIPYTYQLSPHPTLWASISVVFCHQVEVMLPNSNFERYIEYSESITNHLPGAAPVQTNESKAIPKSPPECKVFRVQDPEQLPDFGAKIDWQQLMRTEDIGTTSGGFKLRITPEYDGQTVRLIRGEGDNETIQAQFAVRIPFYFNQLKFALSFESTVYARNPFFNSTQIYLMHNLSDAGMEKMIKASGFQGWGTIFTGWNHSRYSQYGSIPFPGDIPRRNWQALEQAPHSIERVAYDFGTFVADLFVGFIPGVGDFVDWTDFTLMMTTGKDKWGNEVGTFEKVLVGVGVLLPFVGASAVRRVVMGGAEAGFDIWRRSAPYFMKQGDKQLEAIEALLEMEDADKLMTAVGEMDVTAEGLHDFLKQAEAIEDGSFYSQHWRGGELGSAVRAMSRLAQQLFENVRKLENPVSPHSIISGSGEGFIDPFIQLQYRKSGRGKSPYDWLQDNLDNVIVEKRLGKLIKDYDPTIFRKLHFPSSADEFLAAIQKGDAPPTAWGFEWPKSLGRIPSNRRWAPPMPINMPTENGHHLKWDKIRERAWQNYAFYNLTRKCDVDRAQSMDSIIAQLKQYSLRNPEDTISDLKIGRDIPLDTLITSLETGKAPVLPPLNLSKYNLTQAQKKILKPAGLMTSNGEIPSHLLDMAWQKLARFELRKKGSFINIFKRSGMPTDASTLRAYCERALANGSDSSPVVKELQALQDSYIGGRGRLRYTKFGELYQAVVDGSDIPIRSVLEIDHNVRQEAHRLTELLLNDSQLSNRLSGLGDPFNLDSVTQGQHMLQDAHRIAFSSMFDRRLKEAAKEMEEQFLRPFANYRNEELTEVIQSLKSNMINDEFPSYLKNLDPNSKEGKKVRRALWQLNGEILLRGLPISLFPSI